MPQVRIFIFVVEPFIFVVEPFVVVEPSVVVESFVFGLSSPLSLRIMFHAAVPFALIPHQASISAFVENPNFLSIESSIVLEVGE